MHFEETVIEFDFGGNFPKVLPVSERILVFL